MKTKNRWIWVVMLLMLVQVVAPVGNLVSFALPMPIVSKVQAYTLTKGTAASSNDKLTSVSVDEKFDLRMTFQSAVSADTYVEISGSNFEPASGSNKRLVSNGDTVIVFDLVRVGNSNSLTVKYTEVSTPLNTTTETVYVSEAYKIETEDSSSSSSSTTTDRIKKYDPKLTIAPNFAMPVIDAGKPVNLRVPLVVDSKYRAKDVKITFVDQPTDLPFTIEEGKLAFEVPEVTASGATALMNVLVSPLEKSKVYEIKIKMEFKNNYGDLYEVTDSFYVRIQNDAIEPIVGVKDYKFIKDQLTAGLDNAVVLTLENTGTSEAKDVRVELKGFSKDGVRLFNDVARKPIDDIKAGETSMLYYYINTSPYAKTGEYEILAEITYIDIAGNDYKFTSPVYVPVEGTESSSIDMVVENLNFPEKLQAGDSFIVEFDLKNASEVEAKTVEISMEYPTGIIPKSSPKKLLKKVGSDQVEHLQFEFLAKSELETNHYDLYANISYQAKGDDTKETNKEYIGIGVDGRSGLGRPKILVEDYAFEGETVMAGEEFDLKLQFFNTSSDDIVKNIKVSVSSDDGVFSPVDSSSSFFIERIGRQDYSDYVLRLETKRDAQVKTYNLKLTMEYEDGEGNAYDAQEQPFKEEESLGIPVSQPVRLETGEIMAPFEAFVGNPADIEVEFYNMGRSAMYNMFVKLEGDFRTQDGSYFVGNFETGKSDYFTASIIPEEEGEVTGMVVFSFEDALGNPSTVEKEFSFFAAGEPDYNNEFNEEFPMDGEYPDGMNPDGENTNNKMYMYGALALAALIAVVLFVRHKKKKKQAMLLALEDDDE